MQKSHRKSFFLKSEEEKQSIFYKLANHERDSQNITTL